MVDRVDHHFEDRGETSDGLGVFQFALHFNPRVVAVSSMEAGPFLGSTGRGTSCFSQMRPDDQRIFDFACISRSPPAHGPQGSGVLARLTLQPVGGGRTGLVLDGEMGGPMGSNGDDIAFKSVGGSVTVTGLPVLPPLDDPTTPSDQTRPGAGSGEQGGAFDSLDPASPGAGGVAGQGEEDEGDLDRLARAGGGAHGGQTPGWLLAVVGILAASGVALFLGGRGLAR